MGDHSTLSDQFEEPARMRFIILPRSLYDSYYEFYKLAREAALKAEETMLCGTHQYAMYSGRKHFENLPDENLFLERIRAFIDRIENHRTYMYALKLRTFTCGREPEEYIYLTADQALEYYNILAEGQSLFVDTIDEVWGSDYLKNMTRLKDEGRPYDGETCLQEIFNMGIGVYRVQKHTQDLVNDGLVIPQWKALIKAA